MLYFALFGLLVFVSVLALVFVVLLMQERAKSQYLQDQLAHSVKVFNDRFPYDVYQVTPAAMHKYVQFYSLESMRWALKQWHKHCLENMSRLSGHQKKVYCEQIDVWLKQSDYDQGLHDTLQELRDALA